MTRLVRCCVTLAVVVTLTCFFVGTSVQAPTQDVDQVGSEHLTAKVREKREVYFDKMRTCVRQAGLSLNQRNVKCVLGKMYYILKLETEASCKNCLR